MRKYQRFLALVVVWVSLLLGYGAFSASFDLTKSDRLTWDRPAGAVTLENSLPDTVATAGKSFTFQVPPNTFSNEDPDALEYRAEMTNGSNFPGWLNYDASTATFSGIPSNLDHGVLEIRVTADNDDGQSASDVFTIVVQAIPEVDLNGSEFGRSFFDFMDEDGPDSIAITSPDVLVKDNDGDVLTKAIISLSEIEAYDPSEEYLLVPDEGIAAARAAGLPDPVYNPVSGDITIVGTASLEEYAAIFREILYVNISEDVEVGSRIIVFLVTDEDGNESNTIISNIFVSEDNDAPALDLNGANPGRDHDTTYIEDSRPIAIADDEVTLEDIDYHNIGSITITITNRPDSTEETLQVIDDLPAGLSASFDEVTGMMTISGAASLSIYQTVIQRIGYHNASQNPDLTQRRLSIVFDDGDGDESTSSATTLVDIIPVNDPPNTQADTIVVAEYSRGNLVSATLPADVDNQLSELIISVVRLPDLGTLTYADGTPVSVGDVLDSAQFVTLRYDTPVNYDGVSLPGNLAYDVSDGEFSTRSTVTFLINNAPEADDFTVTTDEDTDYPFTLADFADGYTDVEGDALAYILISTLPADGWLLLADDTVRINDKIPISDLNSGKLVFVPELDANGDPYTSFLFRAKDERDALSEPYVAIIHVNPVSDPPAVDTVRVTGEENYTLFFTADDFVAQFSDPENDTLTKIRIESLPSNGVLLLNNEPVAMGDEIPVSRLSQLSFEPDAGFDGITMFRWNGYDGSAYADLPAQVIITIIEDNRISALNDTIRLVDVTTHDDSLRSLVNNPTGGDFTFTTTPIVAPEHGRVTLRDDGTYTYEIIDGFSGTDAFTYEVCNTNNPPGCAQATVTIIVPPPLLVYEGFSPDNDGTNDVWRIRGIENYPNNHVRIFNRWGNPVFEMEGYNNEDKAWSSYSTAGLVAGDVPDGTYFYLIDLGNGQPPRSGYVIVNR